MPKIGVSLFYYYHFYYLLFIYVPKIGVSLFSCARECYAAQAFSSVCGDGEPWALGRVLLNK